MKKNLPDETQQIDSEEETELQSSPWELMIILLIGMVMMLLVMPQG